MKKSLCLLLAVLMLVAVVPFGSASAAQHSISCGDLNADGQISAADAQLALSYGAGLTTGTPANGAGDVNGDGQITALDGMYILKVCVGMIDSFPCQTQTTPTTPSQTQAVTLQVSQATGTKDDVVTLFVSFDKVVSVGAMELTVNYDKQALELVQNQVSQSYFTPAEGSDLLVVGNPQTGKVSVAGTGTQKDLFTMQFRVLDSIEQGQVATVDVTVDQAPVDFYGQVAYTTETIAGGVTYQPVADAAVTFSIDTVEGQKGDVVVLDVTLLESESYIGAFDGVLQYNPQQLQPVNHPDNTGAAEKTIVAGSVLSEAGASFVANGGKFAMATINGLYENGVVFSAAFQVVGDLTGGETAPVSLALNAIGHADHGKDYIYDVTIVSGGVTGKGGTNGPVGGYFYQDGVLVKAYKVVEFEGDYYFISDGNRIVTNSAMAMSASLLAGTDLPAGYYSFDAEGKMTPATGVYGGKYYKDGVTACLYQVVEFEGNYYFVSDGYRVLKNTTTYLDAKYTEPAGQPKGLYAFDENGAMSPATDIYMGKYYENGQNAKLYKVIQFEGDYYFVTDRYKVATNTTLVFTAGFMTEVDLPAGCYSFDAQGKMSPVTGIFNGKYYKNGVTDCLYQVVEFEGNYYFVDDGYRVAKNNTFYLPATYTSTVGLPAGLYKFDATGVMTPATDIYLGKYYENGQPAKLYKAIQFKGKYYYVSDGYRVLKNTIMYLPASAMGDTGLSAGAYQFDKNGVMTPATGIVNGKYYENGQPAKLYQLVKVGAYYYYVSDGYRIVKSAKLTLSEAVTAPHGLPAGTYAFDAQGRMIR